MTLETKSEYCPERLLCKFMRSNWSKLVLKYHLDLFSRNSGRVIFLEHLGDEALEVYKQKVRTLPLTGLAGRGVPFASWLSSSSSGWIKLARSTVSPPPVEAWEGLRRVRGPVVAGASGGEQARALACELRSDYWTSGAAKAVLVEQLSSIRMSPNFAQHHQVFCLSSYLWV